MNQAQYNTNTIKGKPLNKGNAKNLQNLSAQSANNLQSTPLTQILNSKKTIYFAR